MIHKIKELCAQADLLGLDRPDPAVIIAEIQGLLKDFPEPPDGRTCIPYTNEEARHTYETYKEYIPWQIRGCYEWMLEDREYWEKARLEDLRRAVATGKGFLGKDVYLDGKLMDIKMLGPNDEKAE